MKSSIKIGVSLDAFEYYSIQRIDQNYLSMIF